MEAIPWEHRNSLCITTNIFAIALTRKKVIYKRMAANHSYCLPLVLQNTTKIITNKSDSNPAIVIWLYLSGSSCCMGSVFNVLLLVVVLKGPNATSRCRCADSPPFDLRLCYGSLQLSAHDESCACCNDREDAALWNLPERAAGIHHFPPYGQPEWSLTCAQSSDCYPISRGISPPRR